MSMLLKLRSKDFALEVLESKGSKLDTVISK